MRKLDGRNLRLLIEALKSGAYGRIRWDEFRWTPVRQHDSTFVVLNDTELTRLLFELEAAGFEQINEKTLRKAIGLVGSDDPCDVGKQWLRTALPTWDGVYRIRTFLHVYLGTPLDAYHEAVSLYIWTALVARLEQPGIKADMVPVLVGEQGVGKSTALGILAGNDEHYGELNLTEGSNKVFRKAIAKVVLAWEEMRGIRGKCDADEVKTRITSTVIEIDDKAGFAMKEYKRRFVIFGTSNRTDFLRDVTGHRRYLPFTVKKVDRKRLATDIDQLWAEAREIYDLRCKAGLCPIDFENAERLAPGVHPQYERASRWGESETLMDWLDDERPPFKISDALKQVGITENNSPSYWHDERDMAASLRQLGCKQYRPTIAGRTMTMWRAPDYPLGQRRHADVRLGSRRRRWAGGALKS
jgi:predicted P-loop ATPase